MKSADPCVGGVRSFETFLPPAPLRPGPLAARRWAQFVYFYSIRILGPKFGRRGPNPATRGVSAHFRINLNLNELGPYLGHSKANGEPLARYGFAPSDVQRFFCTAKLVFSDVQGPSARQRLAGGWSPNLYTYWRHGFQIRRPLWSAC